MKFAVGNIEEVTWFFQRHNDVWSAEKKHIPETIKKLQDAGMFQQFLADHSTVTEDGEAYVDMDEVFDTLYLESDEVLKEYIKGG